MADSEDKDMSLKELLKNSDRQEIADKFLDSESPMESALVIWEDADGNTWHRAMNLMRGQAIAMLEIVKAVIVDETRGIGVEDDEEDGEGE